MSMFRALGLDRWSPLRPEASGTEYVLTQHPLRRVMCFRNRSIDDIVNDLIVKREIAGYFKLQKQVARVSETVELEHQWNGLRAG